MSVNTDTPGPGSGTDASDDVVDVFWLAGEGCDGCSIATLGATNPGLEALLRGTVPTLPQVELHHPMLAAEWGEEYLAEFRAAAAGERDPYVVVVEGSVPNERRIDGDGYWIALGEEDGEPVRMVDWLDRLAPGAAVVVAIGTCATWGGVPAARGNATDAMGTMDYLGREYRSTLDLPVVNVPGCAPVGDNFLETVVHLLLHVEDVGPLPELDALGRPEWLFDQTVHRKCDRGSSYEEGDFATTYGSEKCIVELGCWGPVVKCNMPSRRNIGGVGGCMNLGGKCIGCTMPGFPDKFTPFFKQPPGTVISSTGSKLLGGVMQRLRQRAMERLDRQPGWEESPDPLSAYLDVDVDLEERVYQWLHKRDAHYDDEKFPNPLHEGLDRAFDSVVKKALDRAYHETFDDSEAD